MHYDYDNAKKQDTKSVLETMPVKNSLTPRTLG
jgi:hypothetical protein